MANCTVVEPSSEELFAYYSSNTPAIVLIVFMSIFTLSTVLMYLEAGYYVNKKVNDSRTRVRLLVILGIYPVYSTTSLLALYIPRAHLITYLTATLYFSVALYQFLMLIVGYFGGREQLLIKLKDTKIPVASPPLLCCVPCLPQPDMNARNLLRLRRIVLQVAFVRPICNFTSLILWANGTYVPGLFAADSAYVWLTVIALCSTFVALYGVIILMRISKKPLEGYNVQSKFFMVQLVLVLITGQLLIIAIPVLTGAVSCEYPMPALTRGYYISDLLTVVEMVVFMLFARFFFRKRVGRTPAGMDHPDHHLHPSKRNSDAFVMGTGEKESYSNLSNGIKDPEYGVKNKAYFEHDVKDVDVVVVTNNNNNNKVSYINEGADDVEDSMKANSVDETSVGETSLDEKL
ncbi:organic solute transporter subunit alpha-like [Diadema antillarum]|uniref:organic solute transporter subunit alpha-like n=1 Tax=Diadema antillarum TaxID=105358 RepID=UPI003A8AC413